VSPQRIGPRAFIVFLSLLLGALLVLPATALGQATPTPSPTAAPSVTLSSNEGAAGSNVTVNGAGFQAGETVRVTFNGQNIGSPTANTGGTWSLAFAIPNVDPGEYVVGATGETSNRTAPSWRDRASDLQRR
jgi:hypothetical protein